MEIIKGGQVWFEEMEAISKQVIDNCRSVQIPKKKTIQNFFNFDLNPLKNAPTAKLTPSETRIDFVNVNHTKIKNNGNFGKNTSKNQRIYLKKNLKKKSLTQYNSAQSSNKNMSMLKSFCQLGEFLGI